MKRTTDLKTGPAFLPGVTASHIRQCHKKETDPKARERLLTYMVRKKDALSIRQIEKRTNRSYSTVRDRPVCARDAGLANMYDGHSGGRPFAAI